MSEFNLEKEIQRWKQNLNKYSQLEPGDINELENHLYDSVDALLEKGFDEEAAFQKATSEIEKGFEETLNEYRYTSTSHEPKSKWLSSWWIPQLLPNILKVFLRNLKRQPGYSFINISGLAIGMACCMIIFLFVQNELSYDTFHEHSERIYRVDQTLIWSDFNGYFSSTGPGVAPTLQADFPEIEKTVRIQSVVDGLVTVFSDNGEAQYFVEPQFLSADSTFFDVFSMKFIEGNAEDALSLPYSVVITNETREKYFENEPGLGKSILLGNPGEEVNYQITGVVEKFPENSHFTFDLLSSLTSNPDVKRRENTWVWTTFVTYVLLNENVSFPSFQEKLNSSVPAYAEAKIYPVFGIDEQSAKENPKNYELFLTPITDIYLNINNSGNRFSAVGDIFYVYVFSSIVLLIIILASINFMNLASARSVHRAKEVGIRKTLGSSKSSLISQFLSEAMLFSFVALILALFLVFLSIDPFNQIAAKNLMFLELFSLYNLIYIIGFTILIGFLAGLYPAFFLTSFNPIEAFKGKTAALSKNKLSFNGLRDSLVVVQFAISIMLISCSVIIYQQIDYLQNENLGFDKEHVLIVKNVMKLGDQSETFKQLIESESGVLSVGKSNAVPPFIYNEDFAQIYGSETDIPLNSLIVDSDYIATLNFEIIQGEEFADHSEANSNYVIINETAIDQLPWPKDLDRSAQFPIGESFYYSGLGDPFEIIGVVKDFNLTSLHSEIGPMAFFHENSEVFKGPNRFLSVRISPNTKIAPFLSSIEDKWNSITNGLPFEFTFLDDQLYTQYQAEQRIAKVVSIFTGLAIFIAILGLLGLISFAIEKRTKEIGIRKVMGASASGIVFLLSKNTLQLIIVSILISTPISWILMNDWLENFSFKIQINPFIFLISGVSAIILAWVVLCFQTIKAASQNPVKSLKSE